MKPFDYSLLAKRALALLCICLLAASALVPLLGASSSKCSSRQNGYIDLSACTFDDSSVFPLDGEWEFYWQQLLDPQDTLSGTAKAPAYMAVPGAWGPGTETTGFSRYGYATYRLLLQLPPEVPAFALKVNNIRNASQVFVNGELLGESDCRGYPFRARNRATTRIPLLSVPRTIRLKSLFIPPTSPMRTAALPNPSGSAHLHP